MLLNVLCTYSYIPPGLIRPSMPPRGGSSVGTPLQEAYIIDDLPYENVVGVLSGHASNMLVK